MGNVELRMENYRNKMLRILIRFAASGRCFNRFYVSKRVLSFSIFHSQFSIEIAASFQFCLQFEACKSFAGLFGNLLQRCLFAQEGELGF